VYTVRPIVSPIQIKCCSDLKCVTVNGSIWFYAPNKGAPVFFATVYCLSGLYHIFQCIHFKSWKLTGVFVFAAILFTGGYIAREMGAFDYTNVDKYIVATVLVYAAP
jgi:hypothetical protein